MKKKITAACLAAGVIVALMSVTATASAQASVGAGLWPDDYQATGQDCGGFGPADANGFCYIDDNGSVELGVKFTSSKDVDVVGVRAYRTDAGSITGSLWQTDGTRLAGPADVAAAGTHAWKDMPFDDPIPVNVGQTYIASYFAPNADYAFEWDRFTNSSYTVGPITAQQSVTGDGNGVFTYGGTSAFPTSTFRDTNYWVTPLWAYRFTGFYQPVDNGDWNGAKAGRTIPVKFSLGGDQGLEIIKDGFPKATKIACPGGSTPVDSIEETVTAGGSSLTYDATADQYVYNWKTKKSWAEDCYRFELGLNDGTSHTFDVQFK